jgi:hypothetical protein
MPKTTKHGGPSNAADLPDLAVGGVVAEAGVVELTAADGPLVPVVDIPAHDPPTEPGDADVPDPEPDGDTAVEPEPEQVDAPVKRRTRK